MPSSLAAPVVDLNGLASGTGTTLAYTENDGATRIATGGTVTDSDSSDFNGGSLTVSFGSSVLSEDQLVILTDANILLNGSTVQYDADGAGGNPAVDIGAVSGGSDGTDLAVSLISANATPAAVTALIQHIAYTNSSEDPSTSARSASFTVNDGSGAPAGSDTATINITPVNDAPVNTVPAPQTTMEDTPLTITGLQVSDADIGSSNITVTLSVAHGAIHVDPNVSGGLDAGDIFDNDTSSVTLSCDPAFVNTTLAASIVYTPNANYNGADTLTIVSDDGGATGTGGAASDSDTVAITISAENDPPVLSGLGDTPSYTENGSPVVLNVETSAEVSDAELDISDNRYEGATLTIARHAQANPDDVLGASGTLDLTDVDGSGQNVSLDIGSGNFKFIGSYASVGDGSTTFTFNASATAADIDALIRQLTYANASDNPPATVQIDFTFSDG